MGMETWINVRTTFTNNFVLEKEICYLRKHWFLRSDMLKIINHSNSEGGSYKINRSDIKDIQAYLIHTMCHDKVEDFDDRGSKVEFLVKCGAILGELEATYRYLNKEMNYIDYYYDEIEKIMSVPSKLCVSKIEVIFEDSP